MTSRSRLLAAALIALCLWACGDPPRVLPDEYLESLESLINSRSLDQAALLIEQIEESVSFDEVHEDDAFITWLFLQGKYHYEQQRFPLAHDYLIQAEFYVLDIDERIEHELYYLIERCNYHRGATSFRSQYLDKYILGVFDDSHEVQKMQSLLKRATIYSREKDYANKDLALDKAFELAQGDSSLFLECAMVANALDTAKNDSSRLSYLLSLSNLVESCDPSIQVTYFMQLSDRMYSMQDYKAAGDYTLQALEIARDIDHFLHRQRKTAENYMLLADNEFQLQQLDAAQSYADSAIALQDFLGQRWTTFLYGTAIEINLEQGDLAAVKKLYYQSAKVQQSKVGQIHADEQEGIKRLSTRTLEAVESELQSMELQRNLVFITLLLLGGFLALAWKARRETLKRKVKEIEVKVRDLQIERKNVQIKELQSKLQASILSSSILQRRLRSLQAKMDQDKLNQFVSYLCRHLLAGQDLWISIDEEVAATKQFIEFVSDEYSVQLSFLLRGESTPDRLVPRLFILGVVADLIRSHDQSTDLVVSLTFSKTADFKLSATGYQKREKGFGDETAHEYLNHFDNKIHLDSNGDIHLQIPSQSVFSEN